MVSIPSCQWWGREGGEKGMDGRIYLAVKGIPAEGGKAPVGSWGAQRGACGAAGGLDQGHVLLVPGSHRPASPGLHLPRAALPPSSSSTRLSVSRGGCRTPLRLVSSRFLIRPSSMLPAVPLAAVTAPPLRHRYPHPFHKQHLPSPNITTTASSTKSSASNIEPPPPPFATKAAHILKLGRSCMKLQLQLHGRPVWAMEQLVSRCLSLCLRIRPCASENTRVSHEHHNPDIAVQTAYLVKRLLDEVQSS